MVRQPGALRWETRLLVVVTAVLTVFGIASLYAAATMQERPFGYFVKQLSGALAGAAALLIVSRVDYHRWRTFAWPLLQRYRFGATVFLVADRIGETNRWDSSEEEISLLGWKEIRHLRDVIRKHGRPLERRC